MRKTIDNCVGCSTYSAVSLKRICPKPYSPLAGQFFLSTFSPYKLAIFAKLPYTADSGQKIRLITYIGSYICLPKCLIKQFLKPKRRLSVPGSDSNIQNLANVIVFHGFKVNLINNYDHQPSLISFPTDIYTLMMINQCRQIYTASAMLIGQYLKIFSIIGSKGLKLGMA